MSCQKNIFRVITVIKKYSNNNKIPWNTLADLINTENFIFTPFSRKLYQNILDKNKDIFIPEK